MRLIKFLFLNFGIIIVLCAKSNAQKPIEIEYEVTEKGGYKFYAINNTYCNYDISLNFETLNNLKSSHQIPFKKNIGTGKNYIFELTPINTSQSSNFNFNTNYQKGCLNPKFDSNFKYLIPIKSGVSTQTIELPFLSITPKNIEPKDFYSIGFKTQLADTIYASRGGVVTKINNTALLKENGYLYSSEDNFIELFHQDCTFGRYHVLSKIFVNEGQKILAGEPIGLSGGEKYVSGPHVRFMVYYSYEYPEADDSSMMKNYWAFIPTHFVINEQDSKMLISDTEYKSIHPEAIIMQEMSNREIKKYLKTKSKK